MAVKTLFIFTGVLLLGSILALEIEVKEKKLRVDPGIFISLETLRHLEASIKLKENASIKEAAAEDGSNTVEGTDMEGSDTPPTEPSDVETTMKPDEPTDDENTNEETNEQTIADGGDNTEDIGKETVASDSNNSDNTEKGNSQQNLPKDSTNGQNPINQQQVNPQSPYHQVTFGVHRATIGTVLSNQIPNNGIPDQHQPVLVNQQQFYGQPQMGPAVIYNQPQVLPTNPQPNHMSFYRQPYPNQHYIQTQSVFTPYQILSHPTNQQPNMNPLQPMSLPMPYQQMYHH